MLKALSKFRVGVIRGGDLADWAASLCAHCRRYSFWYKQTLTFPRPLIGPPPQLDMPLAVKNEYEEARTIADASPRGAAAMLRLAVQKLCEHLEGEQVINLNECIARWVKEGLDEGVQKALDSVRVTGNNAVHPGTMDLNDNPEIVKTLFEVVNFIIEKRISERKRIDQFYDEVLPEEEKQKIANRDVPAREKSRD